MRFGWTGVLLAPLLVTVLFSLAMLAPFQNGSPALGILILMVPACVISYGTTIFLFLPSLFLLSRLRSITGLTACLLGLILGAVVLLPMTWVAWTSSGPDSGPPEESFFVFAARWLVDPFLAICPVAGLVTAGLYWALGTRRNRPSGPAESADPTRR